MNILQATRKKYLKVISKINCKLDEDVHMHTNLIKIFIATLFFILSSEFSLYSDSPVLKEDNSQIHFKEEEEKNYGVDVYPFDSYTPPEVGSLEWESYWRRMRDLILNKEVPLTEWTKKVTEYFLTNPYTLAHLQMWDTIFRDVREYSDELILYAVVFHSKALFEEIKKTNPNVNSILLTSRWLFTAIDFTKESHRSRILELLEENLKKSPLRVEELWRKLLLTINPEGVSIENFQVPPSYYEAIIYLCLTFDAYLTSRNFTKYIVLPELLSTFYKETGILIFDSGILTESHYRSLISIFTSFPPTLHRIRSLIVRESFGGISATHLQIPQNYGIVCDISYIPMEIMSNPDEFPFRIGKQVAPEFALQVVVQLLRATQLVQFRLRPELLIRRDRLLLSLNPRAYNYVRQTVHPSLFLSAPDELLPQSGYVWCLNTDKTLQMANDLLRVRQHFATDVFMLLADLLSEGRDVTLTFYMDEAGILNVREAPVLRLPVDDGFPAVVGISPERIIPEPYIKREVSIQKQSIDDMTTITPNVIPFSSGIQSVDREERIPIPGEIR